MTARVPDPVAPLDATDAPVEMHALFDDLRARLEPALRATLWAPPVAIVIDGRVPGVDLRIRTIDDVNALLAPLGYVVQAATPATTVVIVAPSGCAAAALFPWRGGDTC
jgi:hypothetical protein